MNVTPDQLAAMEARLAANRRKDAKAAQASGIRNPASDAAREADLHHDIMRECDLRGWKYFRSSMAHRTHRTVGEPDFIICLPRGFTLFIEAKSAAGKLSAEQRALHTWLAKFGHVVHVVRNIESFRAVLNPGPAAFTPDPTTDPMSRTLRALNDMAEDRDWRQVRHLATTLIGMLPNE